MHFSTSCGNEVDKLSLTKVSLHHITIRIYDLSNKEITMDAGTRLTVYPTLASGKAD